ncbi:hypothetical protein NXW78_22930 [Bacteroides ovatus]|nr:hypothetical protein [Bacteroides ovatus]
MYATSNIKGLQIVSDKRGHKLKNETDEQKKEALRREIAISSTVRCNNFLQLLTC